MRIWKKITSIYKINIISIITAIIFSRVDWDFTAELISYKLITKLLKGLNMSWEKKS